MSGITTSGLGPALRRTMLGVLLACLLACAMGLSGVQLAYAGELEPAATEDTVAVHQVFDKAHERWLYTASKAEADKLVAGGDWVYEGIAWYAPATSDKPVYRLYNQEDSDYYYTTYKQTYEFYISGGWSGQGICFYSSGEESAPIYCLYRNVGGTNVNYYTSSSKDRDAMVGLGWKKEGVELYAEAAGDASYTGDALHFVHSEPVYKLYNAKTGYWKWTTSESDRNRKLQEGWVDEGVAWYVANYGETYVYGLYNPYSGDYHYTSDVDERDQLVKLGWKTADYGSYGYDGTTRYYQCFRSDSSNTVAIYRLYDTCTAGRHYYTTSTGERDAMVRFGWMDEGKAGWYATKPGDDLAKEEDVSAAALEVLESDLVYDGGEKQPPVRFNGGWWWEQSDQDASFSYRFNTSYSDNVNAGTATVRIALKSNPENSLEATFEIAPRPLDGATIVVSDRVYTGEVVCPEPTVILEGKELAANVDYTVSYAGNVEPGTATVTVTGTGNYTGSASKSFNISVAALPQYRLYNPWSGEHFYTSNASERENVLAAGWVDEGEGWKAPQKSDTPVFRMYNPYAGEHHYCMDAAERDNLIDVGWEYEGIGWYSDDEKRVPLYRDYNPNEPANNHNYTTDKAEHDYLVSLGWVDEGYAWYGMQ